MLIKPFNEFINESFSMIDKGIRKYVIKLNKLGVKTTESCSGHIEPEGSRGSLSPHLTWIKSPEEFNSIVRNEAQIFDKYKKSIIPFELEIRSGHRGYETRGGIFLWTVHYTDVDKFREKMEQNPRIKSTMKDLFNDWELFLKRIIKKLK